LHKNALRNQHYGFSLGGPIRKGRTFFFLNLEEQKYLIGNQSRSTEPSQAYQAEAEALLQQYNVPLNPVSVSLLNGLWPASALTGPATKGQLVLNFSFDQNSDCWNLVYCDGRPESFAAIWNC